MCGIVGATDLNGEREFSRRRLLAMMRAIAHRGPDDEWLHIEPGLAQGARRLAIVDLAHGRQPISNETGDVWVSFNGELFEYPELRQKLLANGHDLQTRCDTEAWAHLYEDHGEGMFEHARGQFAVSLWDQRERKLILGRDRVGICPLFYSYQDGWLLYASEIKALLASGMVAAVPDKRGLDYFFSFFANSNMRTCFEGVTAIPPGHFLRIQNGNVAQKQYWDLDFPDAGAEQIDDPGRLTEELDARLRTAVERRLRGDVSVVSYLSGGLDSTVVLGLCTQVRGEPIKSFSIGLEQAGPDERRHSIESAEILDSPLTIVTMNKARIAQTYPELICAAESPVFDTSCACLLRLAEAVHDQGYKVAMTGEGADENLAGYIWFKLQQRREQVVDRIGRRLPRWIFDKVLDSIGGGRTHRLPANPVPGVRFAQQEVYEFMSQIREVAYTADTWHDLDGYTPYDDLNLPQRLPKWHQLNQSLYVGYRVMLSGLLLCSKGDRVAMHSSVETRYPFLDDDVIEFCARISPQYKLNKGTEKWLLRQVAQRALPERIAQRPKTMFRAKLAAVFLGEHRPPWVDQLLSEESLRATGLFDPAGVRWMRQVSTKRRISPRRAAFNMGVVSVLATQLWYHTFCRGKLADLPVWTAPDVSRI